jgi:hypothetical protein
LVGEVPVYTVKRSFHCTNVLLDEGRLPAALQQVWLYLIIAQLRRLEHAPEGWPSRLLLEAVCRPAA